MNKGDYVKVTMKYSINKSSGYGMIHFEPDEILEVVRVGTNKTLVRKHGYTATAWILNMRLVPYDRHVRKLGETPEGDIDSDDPRLLWLWDDAATLAKSMGLCGSYDLFCNKLGIPGREKDYSVSLEVKGLAVKTSVKARSQKEADAKVRKTLDVG